MDRRAGDAEELDEDARDDAPGPVSEDVGDTATVGIRRRHRSGSPGPKAPLIARRRRTPPAEEAALAEDAGEADGSVADDGGPDRSRALPDRDTSGARPGDATEAAAGRAGKRRSAAKKTPASRPTESRKERDRERQRARQRQARRRAARRRGPLARWAVPLIVLGVIGVLAALVLLVVEPALDRRIRREAEANVNLLVSQRLPGATGVRSTVEGDHLAWTAATSGRIERVKVRMDGATYRDMNVQNVNVQVDDIRIDPQAARSQRVEVLTTGAFRVDADMSEAEVARLGGVTGLKIYEGRAEADGVLGQRAQITLLPGNVLVGTVLGREVARQQLPGVRELGCAPTYRLMPGALRVQCTGQTVPPGLLP